MIELSVIIITIIVSIKTSNWVFANLGGILLCLTFMIQILYAINDSKMIHHRPEIHTVINSDKTITLTTSKYIIANPSIHLYCGDVLYATTWRDNTFTVNVPDDTDEVYLKNRGESTMATIIVDGPETNVYVRSVNKMPITWEVLDIDDESINGESEVEAYNKMLSEFNDADKWNLIMGCGPLLALVFGLIYQLVF